MRRSIQGFYRKLNNAKLSGNTSTLDFAIKRPYEDWMERGAEIIGGRVNTVICHALASGCVRKLAQEAGFQVILRDRVKRPGLIELPQELHGVVPFDDDVDRPRAVRLDSNTVGIGRLAVGGSKAWAELDRLTHNGILILGAMASAENMADLIVAGHTLRGEYREIRQDLYAGEDQAGVIYDYRRFGPLPEDVI